MSSQGLNTVLITGATGFLGKVVVEELFRQRDTFTFTKVALVIRGRNGLSGRERFFKSTAKSNCFSLLPKNWQEAVEVFKGDLGLENYGLNDEDHTWISEHIIHIIHVAGYIKFDRSLAEAVHSNVLSALNVLHLALTYESLQRLITTSTVYSAAPSTKPIDESLPVLPASAKQIHKDLVDGKLNKLEATKLTGHPNIYSLSKCLAEHLLIQQHGSVPLTIVRWIDSKAAFGGFVAGFASGILRVVDGQRQAKLDIVPVDEVASCLIREAFYTEERPILSLLPPKIVFYVATTSNSFTLEEACRLLTAFFKQQPYGSHSPNFRYIGPRNFIFYLSELIYHQLPLRTTAKVIRLLGKQQKAAHVDKAYYLISAMNNIFAPYTNHTYDFRPAYNSVNFDKHTYMEIICTGVIENLLQPRL